MVKPWQDRLSLPSNPNSSFHKSFRDGDGLWLESGLNTIGVLNDGEVCL